MAPVRRMLLVATTTGYQTESFRKAAAALDVELVLATDRCDKLPDPWGDHAVPIRFHEVKGALDLLRPRGPFGGIVASGDRAAVIAARIAEGLQLPFHPSTAAALCHDKLRFRQAMAAAGLPSPWVQKFKTDSAAATAATAVKYPCVLKPAILSGSRGVIRVNDAGEFTAAFERIRQLLAQPSIRQWKDPGGDWILAEGYIPGTEYALEGWMATGELRRFALFDKPDPLEGPFFEETLYLTPSRLPAEQRALIWDMVEAAARTAGMGPGPIHAEIRLDGDTAYVLEVAPRSIGGLCGRSLRFRREPGTGPDGRLISLEELLIRGALGEPVAPWQREERAAGIMMIPIPHSGVLDSVEGVERAGKVPGVEAVEITAKTGEPLQALPEGACYLGFIFARTVTPKAAERALRDAYAALDVRMRAALPVV
ncbi:MAG: ATP-grasp domain-containing protein [Terriglobales bacterium]